MAKRPGKYLTPVDRFEKAATDLVRFHSQLSKKAGPLSAASAKRQKLLETNFKTVMALFKSKATTPPDFIVSGDLYEEIFDALDDEQQAEQLGEQIDKDGPAVVAFCASARATVAPTKGKRDKDAKKGTQRDTARPAAKKTANVGREGSKKAEVVDLMRRPKGATLAEVMKATGWQPHTVWGFVSGTPLKKLGLNVESLRSDDKERCYRITG